MGMDGEIGILFEGCGRERRMLVSEGVGSVIRVKRSVERIEDRVIVERGI